MFLLFVVMDVNEECMWLVKRVIGVLVIFLFIIIMEIRWLVVLIVFFWYVYFLNILGDVLVVIFKRIFGDVFMIINGFWVFSDDFLVFLRIFLFFRNDLRLLSLDILLL